MPDTGPRTAVRAGLAYTAGVFAIAFVVGTIRVLFVAPRVGDLLAVLLEAPIVLAVSWRVSRWSVRRFRVGEDSGSRVLMGGVAFAFLMALELVLAVVAFHEPLEHYVARFATAPGLVGLAAQVCFAAIPWFQHRRDHASARL